MSFQVQILINTKDNSFEKGDITCLFPGPPEMPYFLGNGVNSIDSGFVNIYCDDGNVSDVEKFLEMWEEKFIVTEDKTDWKIEAADGDKKNVTKTLSPDNIKRLEFIKSEKKLTGSDFVVNSEDVKIPKLSATKEEIEKIINDSVNQVYKFKRHHLSDTVIDDMVLKTESVRTMTLADFTSFMLDKLEE